MQRAIWLSLAASVAIFAVGCGSGATSSDGGSDAGVNLDMASGDMTAPPVLTGTKLTTGLQLQLFRVTDDDVAIVSSSPTKTDKASLQAIPLSGAAPTTIAATWSTMIAFPSGVV